MTINYFASFLNENKVFYAIVEGNKIAKEKLKFIAGNKDFKEGHFEGFECLYNQNPDYLFMFWQKGTNQNGVKGAFLSSELAFMRNLINKAKIPKNISVAERNTMEQAVSVLKMSQVSDKDELPLSHGQVLASLRPGVWAISWVRDGTFAISAMAKLGMYDEAKKGLEFMLNAKGNRFKNYIFRDGKNYGPEIDYQISLTRYFGDGTEELSLIHI